MPPRRTLRLPLLLFVVLSAGCVQRGGAAEDRAPPAQIPARPVVSEQSVPLRQPDSPYRTVVHGDTLYSIAWEAGRDYREIATWNRIASPYTIKPGQSLRVLPPPAAEAKTTTKGRAQRPAAKTRSPSASRPGSASTVAKPGPKIAVPAASPPAVTGRNAPDRNSKAAGTVKSDKTPTSARSSTAKPVVAKVDKPQTRGRTAAMGSNSSAGVWIWPADGSVQNRYSESDTKGLDISGTRGAAVRAAASGRVVYQGSGLRGYGQLIIIKHNDEFLSAYAHNDRIYVKEGDVVKRGQKIADMGSTGTDRVKLHFEIRRQGVPIDPLKYLPKR
jgi:lipoprotein NlpD